MTLLSLYLIASTALLTFSGFLWSAKGLVDIAFKAIFCTAAMAGAILIASHFGVAA